jgi:preprotein translocase subunit SecD
VAINPHNRGPLRTLSVLILLIVGLYGLLGAVSSWGTAQRTPKLGLDLSGGTQLILTPKSDTPNQQINQGQIAKAVDIMRARVNGSGVTEAEVSTQGGKDIVVSLPGTPDPAVVSSLQKSSQLLMRGVLVEAAGTSQPAPAPSGPSPLKPTGTPTGQKTATATATTAPKSGLPPALTAATTAPTAPTAPTAARTPVAPSAATPTATSTTGTPTPGAKPKDLSDLALVTPEVQKAFAALDCSKPKATEAIVDIKTKPMVTCSADGQVKYILAPVELVGSDITNANPGQIQSQGGSTGQWEVRLDLTSRGTKAFCDMTTRLAPLQRPRNQSAFVLDNRVISAPAPNQGPICAGGVSITGSFTAQSAKALADQLKFGALPMSFTLQTSDQISPTLGGDQLTRGLLAGGIGLLLVVAYSLLQYRALGLVTVSSLLIAGLLTYGLVTLFGWSTGFRLTMAGVTGLIVSIGIVADSFILYFERVRDEVRDGRALRAAVETGWKRARRTILISDAVNFLAAVVLYALAASNVRGFAFTLMLTTIIDIIVVFLFTHPLLSILANTKFFGQGHRWSGLDPKRLGARTVTYAGRGRVTIADKRAIVEGTQS